MESKLLSKRSSEKAQSDWITTLPKPITDAILCRLQTEEAARTSILSRAWRYKWTTIPKLEFDRWIVSKLIHKGNQRSDLEQESGVEPFCAIHQALLLHQGPINEFSLRAAIPLSAFEIDQLTLSGFEIDQIILHLSRNHPIKKLALHLPYGNSSYNLPLSLFSLHHLTDLSLQSCTIDHDPIFNGFGSLTSLFLEDVTISKITLLHLLSNCPSLRRLSMLIFNRKIDYEQLPITELIKCLPLIEHLTVTSFLIQDFPPNLVQLPTLIHLKSFCVKAISFADPLSELYWLARLIKCSPNLEKIKLEVKWFRFRSRPDADAVTSIISKEYSNVWLEHLSELDIDGFRNYKAEMELMKVILAKSPNLKEVRLYDVGEEKKLELLEVISRSACASGVLVLIS